MTGVVTTATTYDYETQQQYLVTIAVDGLGLQSTDTLTVNIEDENEPHVIDNLPATIAISALTTMENDQVPGNTVPLFCFIFCKIKPKRALDIKENQCYFSRSEITRGLFVFHQLGYA